MSFLEKYANIWTHRSASNFKEFLGFSPRLNKPTAKWEPVSCLSSERPPSNGFTVLVCLKVIRYIPSDLQKPFFQTTYYISLFWMSPAYSAPWEIPYLLFVNASFAVFKRKPWVNLRVNNQINKSNLKIKVLEIFLLSTAKENKLILASIRWSSKTKLQIWCKSSFGVPYDFVLQINQYMWYIFFTKLYNPRFIS